MKLTLHQIEQCDEILKNIPARTVDADRYQIFVGEIGQQLKPLGETAAHCLAEATRCAKTARGLFVLAARTLYEESSAMASGEPAADRQIVLGYLVDSAVGQLRAAEEKFAEAKGQLAAASELLSRAC